MKSQKLVPTKKKKKKSPILFHVDLQHRCCSPFGQRRRDLIKCLPPPHPPFSFGLCRLKFSFFWQLYSDAWFLAGMDEYLRIRLEGERKTPVGPTFVYLFAQRTAASFTEIFEGGKENYYGKWTPCWSANLRGSHGMKTKHFLFFQGFATPRSCSFCSQSRRICL